MTVTARTATRAIATDTADLLALVILGDLAGEFDDCELCGLPSADLRDRLTEDYDEVRACEICIDEHHLGYVAD